jgi:hypothetical protein
MHRALRRDLHELLALVLGKLLDHLELGRRPALGGLVVDVDDDLADVPALALGVHLHRDRRAGGERRGQQLLRVRPGVLTALVLGLVDDRLVLANLDVVTELPAVASCGRFHFLPSNSSGSSSSA